MEILRKQECCHEAQGGGIENMLGLCMCLNPVSGSIQHSGVIMSTRLADFKRDPEKSERTAFGGLSLAVNVEKKDRIAKTFYYISAFTIPYLAISLLNHSGRTRRSTQVGASSLQKALHYVHAETSYACAAIFGKKSVKSLRKVG